MKKPKLVFAHDAKIFENDGKMFAINLSAKLWRERYLPAFAQVRILARQGGKISTDQSKKFSLSSGENLHFSLIPYNNLLLAALFRRKQYLQTIRAALNDCDCVIVRLPSTVGLSVIRECRRYKVPYLIECVGCIWDTMFYHSFVGKVLAPFYYFFTKLAIKNATHVIYITENFLQSRYPTRGKSAVCSNVALPEPNHREFEQKLEKQRITGAYVIGSCGAVNVKYKGQQYVIEAISLLRKKGIEVRYEIIGGGEPTYLKKIAKKFDVEDYVTFLGSKSKSDIQKWLQNLDIYVQPSLSEAQGRSLIEAMRAGCACMCSEAGGMVEFIDKNYIFEKANPSAIVNCFMRIINQPALCMKTAYEASLKFQPDSIQKARISFFSEFIADNGLKEDENNH